MAPPSIPDPSSASSKRIPKLSAALRNAHNSDFVDDHHARLIAEHNAREEAKRQEEQQKRALLAQASVTSQTTASM